MATKNKLPNCSDLPANFFELLASCVMKDPDTGDILGINVILDSSTDCACTPAIDCENNSLDPEKFLVANVFALDDCGQLAIRLRDCSGTLNRQ